MKFHLQKDQLEDRELAVYLPDDYDGGEHRYPVVYVQDGGDLIDPEHSEALRAIRELTARGVLPSLIFVGIVPFDRDDEYTPFAAPNVFEPGRLFGGNAAQYASYLAHALKPYVDSRYRTLPDARNTGIIGFSLGGLISVYTALLYPDVFGRVGSFSGSFWFPGFAEWIQRLPIRNAGQRLYINVGHAEGSERTNGQQWMVPNHGTIYRHLLQTGFTGRTASMTVYESDVHSFAKGVLYVPEAMKWLFCHS